MTFKVSLNPLNIRDNYLKGHISVYERRFGELSFREKINLETELIKNLLLKYSKHSYESYQNEGYVMRKSKILEDALKMEKAEFRKIIEEKFNPTKTECSNSYLIDKSNLNRFIEIFSENPGFNWSDISNDADLDWDLDIIHEGRFVLDFLELQLNPKTSHYFTQFEVIQKYSDLVNWKLVSADKRILWTQKWVTNFQPKLIFTWIQDETISSRCNYFNTCFLNGGSPSGLSMSPHLNFDLIVENIDNWNWEILSSNPLLIQMPLFESPIVEYLNFHGLSHNSGMNIGFFNRILELFKSEENYDFYNPYFTKKNKPKFSWEYAFENANIKWTVDNIKEFIPILDVEHNGRSNWDGISKRITDKNVILKYGDKINFMNLIFNSNQIESFVWNKELLEKLLFKYEGKDLIVSKFKKGLPDILKKINIEREAVLAFKEYWKKTFTSQYYHRNSDGTELRSDDFPLWFCLQQNKNIEWNTELYEAMYDQKFALNELIKIKKNSREGIILATKAKALKPLTSENGIVDIFPSKDYLIALNIYPGDTRQIFKGILDISEEEIVQI